MPTATKVIFAEDAATVHILDGDVEKDEKGNIIYEPHFSKVLLPGDTLELTEVPSYLRKLVEEGKAPGLTLLTASQAKRLNDKAKVAKASMADLVDVIADEDE